MPFSRQNNEVTFYAKLARKLVFEEQLSHEIIEKQSEIGWFDSKKKRDRMDTKSSKLEIIFHTF